MSVPDLAPDDDDDNISIQFAFRKGDLLYYTEKIKSLLPSGGVEN